MLKTVSLRQINRNCTKFVWQNSTLQTAVMRGGDKNSISKLIYLKAYFWDRATSRIICGTHLDVTPQVSKNSALTPLSFSTTLRWITYWNIIVSSRGSITLSLLSLNNNSTIQTVYMMLVLEFFLPHGSWFISSLEEVNFRSSHLTMWPLSCLKKMSRCFVMVSLVVYSEPSTH